MKLFEVFINEVLESRSIILFFTNAIVKPLGFEIEHDLQLKSVHFTLVKLAK